MLRLFLPLSKAIGHRNSLNVHRDTIQSVIECIDSIHKHMHWPEIKLQEGNLTKSRGLTAHPFIDGAFVITLNEDPKIKDVRTTFCHEVGHVIAHHVFRMRKWWDNFDGSFSDVEFKLRSNKAVQEMINAVRDRKGRLAIIRSKKARSIIDEIAQLDVDEGKCKRTLQALAERTTDRELWARAYSQFVAVRSQMPELKGEVDWALGKCAPHSWLSGMWEADDFSEIYKSICELFQTRGELQ